MRYKGYIVKPCERRPGMYLVVTEGRGGKIPNILAGAFTSTREAVGTIEAYLNIRGGKKNVGEAAAEGLG